METGLQTRGTAAVGDEIFGAVDAALAATSPAGLVDMVLNDQHSNDVFEARLDDGRVLMLKRAHHEWGRARFHTAREAARILTEATSIVVPRPLSLPEPGHGSPVQAYWRIPQPTLAEVWPGLPPRVRRTALASWGRLIARVHEVTMPSWGPLQGERSPEATLSGVLRADVQDRLLPALRGLWPDAAGGLERLARLIEPVTSTRARDRPSLAHNDLHMGNVVCTVGEGEVRCIGLLDLDEAAAAPPESDIATLEVLHGPLFAQPLPVGDRERVWEAYGRAYDSRLVTFYRALRLANLGLHSAMVGHPEHADAVAGLLKEEVSRLEREV